MLTDNAARQAVVKHNLRRPSALAETIRSRPFARDHYTGIDKFTTDEEYRRAPTLAVKYRKKRTVLLKSS